MTYDSIQKTATGQGDDYPNRCLLIYNDYSNGCLLVYNYLEDDRNRFK